MGNFNSKDIWKAVNEYYGYDPLEKLFKGELTSSEVMDLIKKTPSIKSVYNKDGSVAWRYLETELNVAKKISGTAGSVSDSTTLPSTGGASTKVKVKIPMNVTPAATAGKYAVKSGITKTALKVASRGNAITGAASTAWDGASAVISIGKGIEKKLYDAAPDFWDAHGMETLDPTTWGKIVNRDTIGDKLFRFIFQVENDESGEPIGGVNYISEDTMGVIALLLKTKRFFEQESSYIIDSSNVNISTLDNDLSNYTSLLTGGFTIVSPGNEFYLGRVMGERSVWAEYPGQKAWRYQYKIKAGSSNVMVCLIKSFGTVYSDDYAYVLRCYSLAPFTRMTASNYAPYKPDATPNFVESESLTHNYRNRTDTIVYTFDVVLASRQVDFRENVITEINVREIGDGVHISGYVDDLMQLALFSDGVHIAKPAVTGSTTQVNKKQINPANITSVATAKQEIYEKIPQIADNRATLGTIQDDGTVTTETYVPVAPPKSTPDNTQNTTEDIDQWDEDLPIWGIDPADNPKYIPDADTESGMQEELSPDTPSRNPDETGTGNTPTIILPSGASQGLWAIYNPTQEQLRTFGAWLWADDFVEQIKKIFADPMQAIIGLHKVYSPVSVSGTQNIQVGYLDSGVSSNVVSQQYIEVDCGTVNLLEYFGNVFDYAPYTTVKLYLPFIGIVDLEPDYVLRSTISIKYGVDVLTGACLAKVNVQRDNAGGVLYQYSGNCSVTYPISSGSYMGVVSGVLGVAGSIAGVLTGGAVLPMVGAGIASAMNAKTSVQHSGSFSGNAGAMGGKIPYLIVKRPITALPDNMEKIEGIPSNADGKVGDYTGYTEFKKVIVKNLNAELSELKLIESQLLEGVYL